MITTMSILNGILRRAMLSTHEVGKTTHLKLARHSQWLIGFRALRVGERDGEIPRLKQKGEAMRELHIPHIRLHLLDNKTGKFLAEDQEGNRGLHVITYGDSSMMCFGLTDPLIHEAAKQWGRPCTVVVSVDGDPGCGAYHYNCCPDISGFEL